MKIFNKDGSYKHENLKKPDKGHLNQFLEISKFFQGKRNQVISFEDIHFATQMSFIIDTMSKE